MSQIINGPYKTKKELYVQNDQKNQKIKIKSQNKTISKIKNHIAFLFIVLDFIIGLNITLVLCLLSLI